MACRPMSKSRPHGPTARRAGRLAGQGENLGLPSRASFTSILAFDLIEFDGDDLRREPLDVRKATLSSLLRGAAPALRLNEHIEGDGPTARTGIEDSFL